MQNFGVTNKEHYGMLWYFLEWPRETETVLMQNLGVTNKEHYGMLWYFLEWSIDLLQMNIIINTITITITITVTITITITIISLCVYLETRLFDGILT